MRSVNSGGIDYGLLYSTDLTTYSEYPFDANILDQHPCREIPMPRRWR